jgi:hypothetical protein
MTLDEAAALKGAIAAAIALADAGKQLLVAALLQQAHDMVQAG